MSTGLRRVEFKPLDESAEYLSDEGCHILELSNDAADPSVSIARARVTPGVATRAHRLTATEERYVVLSGGGLAVIGEEPRRVGPGDVVLIPAGVTQRIENDGSEDLVFLCICSPRFEWRNYEDLG